MIDFPEQRISAKMIREMMCWSNNTFWRKVKEEGFPKLFKDGRINYCLKSEFLEWAKKDREEKSK